MSKIKENISLAEFTTLKIGGNARYFMCAENENDVFETLEFADANKLELFILGGGSNILVSDEGFDGMVLQISIKEIKAAAEKGGLTHLTVGAGVDWDLLVEFCVHEHLAGLECLSGIPGFVGGTPVQNVGAYGQEVSETIVSVKVFDRKSREIKILTNAECGFEYRKSIFNTTEKNRYIVLNVTFALEKNGKPKIVYQDLQKHFAEKEPNLIETRYAVLEIRRKKSMVIDSNDINSQSAGSFFKNPVVDIQKFSDIEAKSKQLHIIGENESVPHFSAGENAVKIPAAWLIEKAGFYKGYLKGNVGLSENHTLALTNRGGATARELVALKDEIQTKVAETFDVEIFPEPVFVGFK